MRFSLCSACASPGCRSLVDRSRSSVCSDVESLSPAMNCRPPTPKLLDARSKTRVRSAGASLRPTRARDPPAARLFPPSRRCSVRRAGASRNSASSLAAAAPRLLPPSSRCKLVRAGQPLRVAIARASAGDRQLSSRFRVRVCKSGAWMRIGSPSTPTVRSSWLGTVREKVRSSSIMPASTARASVASGSGTLHRRWRPRSRAQVSTQALSRAPAPRKSPMRSHNSGGSCPWYWAPLQG
mmetsp:Transcript_132165/g.229147  ORF Transcript_132165/g.229147 Transcript_132165/m.229147 type:complete len:239 (-) Transcript_132165:446-1162(-)